jgi:hypothetical protein
MALGLAPKTSPCSSDSDEYSAARTGAAAGMRATLEGPGALGRGCEVAAAKPGVPQLRQLAAHAAASEILDRPSSAAAHRAASLPAEVKEELLQVRGGWRQ